MSIFQTSTPPMTTPARPGNLTVAGFRVHIDGPIGTRDTWKPDLSPEELNDLTDLLELLLAGKLRRWHLDIGTGGFCFDAPAEWDELKVLHECMAYRPGHKIAVRPSSLPSGSYGWVGRLEDDRPHPSLISWPHPQLALDFETGPELVVRDEAREEVA